MTSPADAPRGAARRDLTGGGKDLLVREEPLLLKVGEAQLLTMRTPGEDEALALGFLLSEGVIRSPGDVRTFRFTAGDPAELRADTLDVELAGPARQQVKGKLTRTHEIRSSCGVCGLVDPDELLEDTPPLLPSVPRVRAEALPDLHRRFEELQRCFQATGACHGAAIFAADGSVLGLGEDVGRHNALDKAIGVAARNGADLSRALVLLSGRAGYDLVIKCLRVRLPVILSVSAPSALSFDLCKAAGATLIGFLRGEDFKVYCDSGRLSRGSSG